MLQWLSPLSVQFQPNRRPSLRVLREALRETADGGGGDLRLRCGVTHPRTGPAPNSPPPLPHTDPQPVLAQNRFDLFTHKHTSNDQVCGASPAPGGRRPEEDAAGEAAGAKKKKKKGVF